MRQPGWALGPNSESVSVVNESTGRWLWADYEHGRLVQVGVVEANGKDVARWEASEIEDDPVLVVGAIIGALAN